jgi:hypothetical protein
MKPRAELMEHLRNNAEPAEGGMLRAQGTPLRLELLSDEGYYAQLENEGKVIKIYGRDTTHLFGLNPDMIPFEVKPLTVAVQVYVMAHNQGHRVGYDTCKNKVTEMLKLCL